MARKDRKNSNSGDLEEVDCAICCCDVDCHNPLDGCCDAIHDWVVECCEPCTRCISSACSKFAYIWYIFGCFVQYLAFIAYIGVQGYVCYYAFTCTGTTFTCDEKKECTAAGKDPIEGAWTPDMLTQLCTVAATALLLISQVWIQGICSGYFNQPFDKSEDDDSIEHTLWMTIKHVFKYMMLLPITSTSFILRKGIEGQMGMCYNNQLGNFLWGALDAATMAQVGCYTFLALIAILIVSFFCMSCAKSASCLCMECHCFSEEWYRILCWGAITPIWVGVPIGIVFQVSAFFIDFLSPGNAVLALMVVADFGYFLQYICAYAAPEGSRARRKFEEAKENQATGSENAPMVS